MMTEAQLKEQELKKARGKVCGIAFLRYIRDNPEPITVTFDNSKT